jgi:hypothetical protein
MTIALNNGLASVSINVNETSITPAGTALITGSNASYGSGVAYYSNNVFTVPAGIYALKVWLVGGGGGGGRYAGGGGGGGQVRSNLTYTVTPGQTLSVLIGAGGAPGATGSTTQFGAFQALGGNSGSAGATRTGGTGGQSGSGTGGVAGTSSAVGSVFNFYGGGGGSDAGGQTGNAGGNNTNITIAGRLDNWYVAWGGGGWGGTTTAGSATTTRGYSTAQTWPGIGLNGANNTGDGAGGGDASPATPHGNTITDAAITGYAGGTGGSGMIIVQWGP